MSDLSNESLPRTWRTSNYDDLVHLDRAGWAWEFLRRNAAYRDSARDDASTEQEITHMSPTLKVIQAARLSTNAERWGLRFR